MKARAEAIQSAYDRWSSVYDADANPTRDLDSAVLRAADLPLDGARVIEFGCGTGKNTAYLAARAAEVVALDFSAGMLAQARRCVAAPNVRFIEHDISRPWPLPDRWATFAVGNLVLEHIDNLAPVFTHAHAALEHGALLFCCELHPARQLLGKSARFTTVEGEVRIPAFTHTLADFSEAARAAGFRLIHSADHSDSTSSLSAPPRLLSLLFSRDG